jgi:hypothetical protein
VKAVLAEILGLFVDDQGLALWILAVVALALAIGFGFRAPTIAGAVLTLGCVSALAASVLKANRRAPSPAAREKAARQSRVR